jgi:stage II sporulation protein P
LEEFPEHFRESPPPWLQPPEKPAFSREDAQLVELFNTSKKHPDLETLLEKPLCWDLRLETPTVLILHTHGSESYTPGEEPYEAVSAYRTLEENRNMLSIGSLVAEILEENGIGVIHDRRIFDYPSYNGAYSRTRESISEHLVNHPGIRLVLDLHRDASASGGKQLRTEAVVDGKPAAQLMLVQGTNYETWEENLSLAVKLQVFLEREYPGIMRPINLRGQRFNQDLSPGVLLVEVGAAGNTRQEALLAASALAEALTALAQGSE